jgi:23S rRNA pseudouridine1911/1915/1917 synthase
VASDERALIDEVIPPALEGERLDRVVALIADVSRADASRAIAAGGVTVDDELAGSGKLRLRVGQSVRVDTEVIPRLQPPGPDADVPVPVVYEDADVVVVDKPAGLVVHPGAGNPDGTLVNGLLSRYPDLAAVGDPQRPGIVHRLDAGSSGLLVVARTPVAASALGGQFADHSARRVYHAVVWGVPEVAHGIVDAPVGRSRRDPTRMAVVAGGRPARTDYRVVETYRRPVEAAFLECRLETGRTHQIRVHLASIDHPLVGDPTYGGRRPALGLDRPFLHAAELGFDHPTTGERLTFHSPLPDDLRAWRDAAEP